VVAQEAERHAVGTRATRVHHRRQSLDDRLAPAVATAEHLEHAVRGERRGKLAESTAVAGVGVERQDVPDRFTGDGVVFHRLPSGPPASDQKGQRRHVAVPVDEIDPLQDQAPVTVGRAEFVAHPAAPGRGPGHAALEQHEVRLDDQLAAVEDAPWTERDNDRRGYRLASDVTRFIQVGTAEGELRVDGRIVALSSTSTFAVRDHSWGIRQHVGVPAPDHRDEAQIPPGYRFMMTWAPALLTLPDGQHFQAHLAQWTADGPGQNKLVTSARVIEPDGRQLRAVRVTTCHTFEPASRLATGATIDCELEDGTARHFRIDAVGDTRSCLGPALYYGFDGHYHGEYRGRLAVDGERIGDTADPAIQARIHRLRDVVARVTEKTTNATGWCGLQVEAVGAFPEYGLDEDYAR
jgi:hypothetical protein